MICRCCFRTLVPITAPLPRSLLVSSSGLRRFANTRLRTSSEHQVPERFCTTCIEIRSCRRKACPFRVPPAPAGASCASSDVSWIHLVAIIDHSIAPSPWKRSNSISRMRPACHLILMASSSMSWKFVMLWMPEPLPGSWPRPARIFTLRARLPTVVQFLIHYGCPPRMTFDRDTRWVGSYGLRHFPSAFCRFLLCLGIQPTICPPRRPDKNAYVERLHRTLNQEWGPRSSAQHAWGGARGHQELPVA